MYTILEDLLPANPLHTVFSDQPFFCKLLPYIFTLEWDASPYPAMYDFIFIAEKQNDTLLHKNEKKNKGEDELPIIFLEKHISLGKKTFR